MKLAVHVTAMNRPETLLRTLRAAVALSAAGCDTSLTVVDNESVDLATLELLDELDRADVTVLRNRTNEGLARAVNRGLAAGAAAGADVLIHLDDDAVVRTADWDAVLASYFAHPAVGLVVPAPAGIGIPKGGLGAVTPQGGTYAEIDTPAPPAGAPPYHEVSWGLGFCWALRRDVYDRIGGYDPQLLHQSECDLGLRVRLAGYEVAGIDTVDVLHNDPARNAVGAERSALSLAREHLGTVQFRDKWCQYFHGAGWTYGTMPLSLMPHWPPDQDLLRRFAEYHGVDLNPPPGVKPALGPGAVLGLTEETLRAAGEDDQQMLRVGGVPLLVYRTLRHDYAHWERGDAYARDRLQAIARWAELTGETYCGYDWGGHLKPRGQANAVKIRDGGG